jgi:hypothetical protein
MYANHFFGGGGPVRFKLSIGYCDSNAFIIDFAQS